MLEGLITFGVINKIYILYLNIFYYDFLIVLLNTTTHSEKRPRLSDDDI